MPENKEKRALLILYLLGAYILFQLIWWGWLQYSLTAQLIAAKGEDPAVLSKKVWMIAGEGGVFVLLLLFGFFQLRKTVMKELRLARMEKTFLLSVTHELKTPIAAVKLMLETLKRGKLNAEEQSKVIADAQRETQRLQSLSENILLATRFDQQKDGFHSEEISLTDIVNQTVHRMQQLFGEKYAFTRQVEEDVLMEGDSQLLHAMCLNLLENAVKYSPEQSEIIIKLERTGKHILFSVSDSGPGIPDDEKKRIFDKFYRLGNEETRKHKGTGLGLYLVRNIARMHSGHASVVNRIPQGSTFVVRFDI